MECTFVADEDSMETCGEEATLKRGLVLCNDHHVAVIRRGRSRVQHLAKQSLGIHPFESFPGYCYVILLPTGKVKIGYSNTPELLHTRLVTHKRELGPVVKLLILPGGFVTEAYLHSKFQEDRIEDSCEQFHYSEELAGFIAEHVEKYSNYQHLK